MTSWLQWLLHGKLVPLTHLPHIYASVNRVCIGSDNDLSPIRRQAIIKTNAASLSISLFGTIFNEILIKIQTFSFTKMHLKLSSAKFLSGAILSMGRWVKSLAPERVAANLDTWFSSPFQGFISGANGGKLISVECRRMPLVVSQHWLR